MTFASSLLAKLLIAATVITPAAGYGGYCLYEYCTSSSFDKQMTQQGYKFSSVYEEWTDGATYIKNTNKLSEKLGRGWKCSQQLFENITIPPTNAATSDENATLTLPTTPTISSSETESIGCLVADLGHTKDTANKKAGFLSWELALRSGNRGFIYIGVFSAGNIEGQTETRPQQSYSIVFEVLKESDKWNIKNGLYWVDDLSKVGVDDSGSPNFSNLEVKVVLPNKQEWKTSGQICDGKEGKNCNDEKQWEFKRYVGFWEKEDTGQQFINAMQIETKETQNNKIHKHDIWSNEEFDFERPEGSEGTEPVWKTHIDHVYDSKTKAWGRITAAGNAKDYLKAIYSPWAKKKGTWKDAKGFCDEYKGKNLGYDAPEVQKILKFCYTR